MARAEKLVHLPGQTVDNTERPGVQVGQRGSGADSLRAGKPYERSAPGRRRRATPIRSRHALDGTQPPLIVFTPKSMLRDKPRSAASRASPRSSSVRCSKSRPEQGPRNRVDQREAVLRVVASKTKDKRDDVAVVRIKPLAPLFERLLSKALDNRRASRGSSGYRRSRATKEPDRGSPGATDLCPRS